MASTTQVQERNDERSAEPFSVKLVGTTYRNARLLFGSYAFGGAAVQIGNDDGLICTASVNVAGYMPGTEHCVLIKDYSENSGLADQLQDLGFIVPTGRSVSSGFVSIDEYELTPKALAFRE